jgi:hypothetical protein
MEYLLDSTKNTSQALPALFNVRDVRVFTCEKHSEHKNQQLPGESTIFVLNITKAAFERNKILLTNVADLIAKWTSTGINISSGIHCRPCKNDLREHTKLDVISRLDFIKDQSPLHLYFLVDMATIFSDTHKRDFMGNIEWPFKLNVRGQTYTLFSHGYWTGAHFYCKVVRNVGGTAGVWLHNDMINQGNCCMVDKDPSAIGGRVTETSRVQTNWEQREKEKFTEKKKKLMRGPNDRP